MYKKLFSILLILSVSLFFACGVEDIVWQLTLMNQDELNDLYGNLEPGPIPVGESKGTVIVGNGRVNPRLQLWLLFLWHGKTFKVGENEEYYLVNRVGLRNLEKFPADVYYGDSVYDGNEAIILDYSKDLPPDVPLVQDEMRLVEEDVYLGQAWAQKKDGDWVFLINFVCDLRETE